MGIPAELRGRQVEWKQVIDALSRISTGSGSVLLIEGGPGTGKSLLLQETAQAARQRRFTVMARQPTRAGLAHDAPQPANWLTEQLGARLHEQAALGPVLVVVDDIHDADPAWLAMLSDPLPLVSTHPVVWAVARRAGEGGAQVDRLFSTGNGATTNGATTNGATTRIQLGPLSDTVVAEVVAELVGAAPQPDLLDLVATAAGDPLLVVELVQGLRDEGKLSIERGEARLRSTDLPRRVHAIVQERLAPLSAKSRQLIQVASVLGKTFAVHDVAEMLCEATATLLPALEESLSAGLLGCDSERLTFSNCLVWRIVRESIPPSVRHALVRDASLILAARDDMPAAARAGSTPAGSAPPAATMPTSTVPATPTVPATAAFPATTAPPPAAAAAFAGATQHARTVAVAGTTAGPTTRSGATALPTARAGATAVPGASAGTAVVPGASAGTAAVPGAFAGTAAVPGAFAGTAAVPGAFAGTAAVPGAFAGTAAVPGAFAGTAAVPGAFAGTAAVPGAFAGAAALPATTRGLPLSLAGGERVLLAAALAETLSDTARPDPARIMAVVDAHAATGDLASTAALIREALALPLPPPAAAALQARLAHVLIMNGQPHQATTAADQALGVPDLPDLVHEEATAARILALSLYDESQARHEAEAILAGRRRPGDPAGVTAATVLSNLVWDSGDLAESLRLARTAVAGIRSTTPPVWRSHARLTLARKLSNSRDFAAAEAIIRETQLDTDNCGPAMHIAAPAIARARLLAQVGRLAEARVEARAALAQAQEVGAHLLVPLALSVLATVALRTGDLLTAADYIRRYRVDLATGNTPLWSAQYDWVELLLAAEQDGPRRALEQLASHHAELPTRRLLFVEEPGAAAWLVRLAVAVGDVDVAKTAVHTAECLAARNPGFRTVAAAALHARGLLDRDAVALAQAAHEHLEPWAAAWAAEDLGLHVLDTGSESTGTAVGHLENALRGFEDIGAERDAARVRNRLRALGVRRRRIAVGRNAASGWGSLNEMERTIAHLVNQGLTNRQIAKRVFLSPHTVNYHLRQIFRKLDIKSRVELARLTQEQYLPRGDAHPYNEGDGTGVA